MSILDETFGWSGWQREHSFKDGHNYCKISIWDKEKGQWISKEDIGTESSTDAEKGEASDAFKRACFNVGIGRELYTSPFIWVALNPDELYKNPKTQKWQLNTKVHFHVESIEYDSNRNISAIRIFDQRGNMRFEYPCRRENSSVNSTIPNQKATPTQPLSGKKSVTMDALDDEVKCDCLMRWAYDLWIKSDYDPEFDAGARLLKSYEAKETVVNRFRALFASYKIARKNGNK